MQVINAVGNRTQVRAMVLYKEERKHSKPDDVEEARSKLHLVDYFLTLAVKGPENAETTSTQLIKVSITIDSVFLSLTQ